MSAAVNPIKRGSKKPAEVAPEKKTVKKVVGKTMVLVPRMSEKAYAVSQSLNTYVFNVPKDANKQSIAEAVGAQFEVTVIKVNITNVKGKVIRSYRKRSRAVEGRQSNAKKAYVTLKEGDSLPLFAAVEEQEAKSEKLQEAAEKAAEKRDKKEKK